jgi:hypothetical protein
MAVATTKQKIKACSARIKGPNLKVRDCGTPMLGERCANGEQHILPFPTGFCQMGACEGRRKESMSGVMMKTCSWWQRCPCDCHKIYDTLFGDSEMQRIVVDNSGYEPSPSPFWMPSPEERIAMLAEAHQHKDNAPRVIESPMPEVVPMTLERSYNETPTGRLAPGQLEAWVKYHCDVWLVEKERFPCIPTYLAAEIARKEGIPLPSVGAIAAVFDRWAAIGFAVTAKKPVRFERYTEDGIRLGLEGCKDRAKRNKRAAEAHAGRRIGKG